VEGVHNKAAKPSANGISVYGVMDRGKVPALYLLAEEKKLATVGVAGWVGGNKSSLKSWNAGR